MWKFYKPQKKSNTNYYFCHVTLRPCFKGEKQPGNQRAPTTCSQSLSQLAAEGAGIGP